MRLHVYRRESKNGSYTPISLSPDSDMAASFSKHIANMRSEISHAHTKTNNACTHLHAAPACLRHCQEEEKWSIDKYIHNSQNLINRNKNTIILETKSKWYSPELFLQLKQKLLIYFGTFCDFGFFVYVQFGYSLCKILHKKIKRILTDENKSQFIRMTDSHKFHYRKSGNICTTLIFGAKIIKCEYTIHVYIYGSLKL